MTLSKNNNTSIISKGLCLRGNLVSDGLLEVEGKIEGNVKGNEITIRESGLIDGKIVSNTLNIKGSFIGTIKSQKINISGKASIKGTLEYVVLCVEDGASIVGDLKRVDEIILEDDETILQSSKQTSPKKEKDNNYITEDKKDKKEKNNKKGKRGRPRKNPIIEKPLEENLENTDTEQLENAQEDEIILEQDKENNQY